MKNRAEFISFAFSTYTRTEKPGIVKTCLNIAHDDERETHHALQLSFDDNVQVINDTVTIYHNGRTQSQVMADCIEFYDDWGTGDNIKLDIYYRMCDEILAEIRNCSALLETNKSRYDGALHMEPGKLHDDKELHILLFDIIYCSQVYDLFDGITFARPKTKEVCFAFLQSERYFSAKDSLICSCPHWQIVCNTGISDSPFSER